MPTARATGVAESDDEYAPPSQGAARGAKKHPVTEAVLRFATEKKGPKAGPYVNKIFEQAIEGAEQEATQIEGDDDDARAVPIANMLMMIVAWLYYPLETPSVLLQSKCKRRDGWSLQPTLHLLRAVSRRSARAGTVKDRRTVELEKENEALKSKYAAAAAAAE